MSRQPEIRRPPRGLPDIIRSYSIYDQARRARTPEHDPDHLRILWGRLPDMRPGLIVTGGEDDWHRRLLMHAVTSESWTDQGEDPLPSLAEELHGLGYDLSTLKISIKKRVESPAELDRDQMPPHNQDPAGKLRNRSRLQWDQHRQEKQAEIARRLQGPGGRFKKKAP